MLGSSSTLLSAFEVLSPNVRVDKIDRSVNLAAQPNHQQDDWVDDHILTVKAVAAPHGPYPDQEQGQFQQVKP